MATKFSTRFKVMSAIIGTLVSTLTAIVLWQQAGLPVPATIQFVQSEDDRHAEVDDQRFIVVEDNIKNVSAITLGLLRGNLEAQLDRKLLALEKTPNDPELKQDVRRLERQIDDVQRNIERLTQGDFQ